MPTLPAMLLFDDGTGDLGPLSDLRASFEQRTGGLALLERVGAGAALSVPEALEAVVRERHGEAALRLPAGPVLCVNGRFHAPIDAGAVDASAAGARGVAVRAAELGMAWPQVYEGGGWETRLAKENDVKSIPATYLLDRKGVVRFRNLRGEELAKRVAELLAEKP